MRPKENLLKLFVAQLTKYQKYLQTHPPHKINI